jgi:methylmalonyl-CoA mutase
LARNTQLILLEESNHARVADPAAGSGGIEALTQHLCGAAWAFFQEIEAAGGAHTALTSGLIARKVAAIRHEREAAVARGREPITGTSEFPDIHELPVAVLAPAPAHSAATGGDLVPEIRLAEPFEQLRDAADDYAAKTGSRPKVFLANLGTPSVFTARATFAKNFFEAGGIEAVTNDGFKHRGAGDCVQDLGRALRLPVLIERRLREGRRRGRHSAREGRGRTSLSRRARRRIGERAEGRGCCDLHLFRLRHAKDASRCP